MDITYMHEAGDEDAARAPSRGPSYLRRATLSALRLLLRFVRCAVRLLAFDLLSNTPLRRFRDDTASSASRFMRGALYRAAFLPIVIALLASALVFSSTHPLSAPAGATRGLDPASLGLYFEAAAIVNSDDGERMDAWLIPSIDARQVVRERGNVFRETYPAVVLVHDFDGRKQQMLPFARSLHGAGFTVLIVGLRGASQGAGGARATGQTLGLHEAGDVRAAIEMLRKRPFVDDEHIAIVGIGTGANASLIAFNADPRLAAAVLIAPNASSNDAVARHIAPANPWFHWLTPICKWTFELAYAVDADVLDVSRYESVIRTRPVLTLDESAASDADAVRDYLVARMLALKPSSKIANESASPEASTLRDSSGPTISRTTRSKISGQTKKPRR